MCCSIIAMTVDLNKQQASGYQSYLRRSTYICFTRWVASFVQPILKSDLHKLKVKYRSIS